jgi:hypothetical protein
MAEAFAAVQPFKIILMLINMCLILLIANTKVIYSQTNQ